MCSWVQNRHIANFLYLAFEKYTSLIFLFFACTDPWIYGWCKGERDKSFLKEEIKMKSVRCSSIIINIKAELSKILGTMQWEKICRNVTSSSRRLQTHVLRDSDYYIWSCLVSYFILWHYEPNLYYLQSYQSPLQFYDLGLNLRGSGYLCLFLECRRNPLPQQQTSISCLRESCKVDYFLPVVKASYLRTAQIQLRRVSTIRRYRHVQHSLTTVFPRNPGLVWTISQSWSCVIMYFLSSYKGCSRMLWESIAVATLFHFD